MKYILLLFITIPIFSQSPEDSKSTPVDNTDNSTKTIEPEKEASQTSTESADNTNLTQAEIRKKRKLEFGIGRSDGDIKDPQARKFLNLNLEYNMTARVSIGYSHFHRQKFSTAPYINPVADAFKFGIIEKTNSLELGLFNFRYYFFEKFPLYITAGLGRDFVSRYKRIDYQYGFIYRDFSIQNSPLVRETEILPATHRFLGFGFQWVFQNGFFIGTELVNLQSRFTYKGSILILDKNYDIVSVLIREKIFNPTNTENHQSYLANIRLGYSLQF